MSDHCGAATNRMLGCISEGITTRYKEVIIPLYSVLSSPDPEYCAQFWSPLLKKKKCGQAVEDPENDHKDYQRTVKPDNVRKEAENRFRSALRIKGLGKNLSLCSCMLTAAKKMEAPFLQGVTWKT